MKKNCSDAGAGIRTLVDLRQQVLSLSPLASRAPPLIKTKDTIETIKNLNKFFKMLRPGFEPESSARKAEMIGRTTLSEQDYILLNGPNGVRTHGRPVMSRALYLAKLWAQLKLAPSAGLEPATNRLTAERSTY